MRRDDITDDNIMIDKQQCIEESSENIATERAFSFALENFQKLSRRGSMVEERKIFVY